ncbi:MAG: 2-methoxy-6-polyprenyl-1,4-benzoquinol methylase, mitochondrial [Chroococcidiopsis cubana SAG 39.79]|uniref:Methyltransferase type 11 domain-containing protein n=1 Tax=Chroococcidiopsis cubana SAG 39.79 TaxID=388085 RepID=A0AB37UPQ2_9CYAN|nr:class I SAM-dependent methyltransferase [Chroococcidiopsis cubana]MDZ4876142.1 2-methoxy-6-polyprenyl-1,4-benzoquinol methylase, mitochondrial [Chroococcidiopsis cubana SAG 39.79]PSB60237.1 hypothetical protein C7B79_26510 [Chroococcidiopsis cubana CCALA 043]RUT13365.1 hypothetical protein DSM107010_13200 [Chroococcidiopsis cubana SAG 39.79]
MLTLKNSISYAVRGVNTERLNAILENAGQSVLDVGCGNGTYVLKLADRYNILGVDIQHFETWNAMPHLFSVSDASELKFKDSSFDTVLSFETLEHLPEPKEALREYYRICRKNLILTVPNCDITSGMRQSLMTYYHWVDRTHVNFFDMDTITEAVKEAGFKVVKHYYINQLSLLPLLTEAFNLSGLLGKLVQKILLKRQQRKYYITCLVVAEK